MSQKALEKLGGIKILNNKKDGWFHKSKKKNKVISVKYFAVENRLSKMEN